MCFIATVNFMRAVKLSGGVCCQQSCCLNQRFINIPSTHPPTPTTPQKWRKKLMKFGFPPLPEAWEYDLFRVSLWNDKSLGGIEMQQSLCVSMFALNFLHWLGLKEQWVRFILPHNTKNDLNISSVEYRWMPVTQNIPQQVFRTSGYCTAGYLNSFPLNVCSLCY